MMNTEQQTVIDDRIENLKAYLRSAYNELQYQQDHVTKLLADIQRFQEQIDALEQDSD